MALGIFTKQCRMITVQICSLRCPTKVYHKKIQTSYLHQQHILGMKPTHWAIWHCYDSTFALVDLWFCDATILTQINFFT